MLILPESHRISPSNDKVRACFSEIPLIQIVCENINLCLNKFSKMSVQRMPPKLNNMSSISDLLRIAAE